MNKKALIIFLALVLGMTCFSALAVDAVSSATVNVTVLPEMQEHENADTLVIWFSTNDTVKAVALTVADALGADNFEIVPEQPYTEADLAYYTDGRCDREQADDTARPGIANWPESLDQYNVIFIGYPIWHGQAPRILYTLLEGIDLSGKTIVPFCTSMSSGAGSSARNLQALTDETAIWLNVKRIENRSTVEDIRTWALSVPLEQGEANMQMSINGTPVSVIWEENDSVSALCELASAGLTIHMSMYGGFEQVGDIGQSLPADDVQTMTKPGDIVLYAGDRLVVFYGSNSWAYTQLGHITDQTPDQMEKLLSDGNVTITLTIK